MVEAAGYWTCVRMVSTRTGLWRKQAMKGRPRRGVPEEEGKAKSYRLRLWPVLKQSGKKGKFYKQILENLSFRKAEHTEYKLY